MDPLTRQGMAPEWKRMAEVIDGVGFGSICDQVVSSGLPDFRTPPRVIRDIKLRGSHEPARRKKSGELKDPFVELMRLMRQLGDGVIERIDVQNSIPVRVILEEQLGTRRDA